MSEERYARTWRAVLGSVRSAQDAHPEIEIPEDLIASLVKRIVGQVLALEAGPARPAKELCARVKCAEQQAQLVSAPRRRAGHNGSPSLPTKRRKRIRQRSASKKSQAEGQPS